MSRRRAQRREVINAVGSDLSLDDLHLQPDRSRRVTGHCCNASYSARWGGSRAPCPPHVDMDSIFDDCVGLLTELSEMMGPS
jgi:hypothetical protein